MSKIQFRKLFTTWWVWRSAACLLCEICQRYNFESYSQLRFIFAVSVNVVWDMSKIQFRKLFTTNLCRLEARRRLCEICQRYNFESYSQRGINSPQSAPCCVRYVKDTISKAIHNRIVRNVFGTAVVWDMSKIQFRKLFTTSEWLGASFWRLCEICQRYNFESYSQQARWGCWRNDVVWDMSKIQFRKLFTTFISSFITFDLLCEICQRYNFESYSQRIHPALLEPCCCVRYVKDTISKAIHNSCFGLKFI